jgi:pSer/pThr/pTyr-binding forkhead associated (FHA) protein
MTAVPPGGEHPDDTRVDHDPTVAYEPPIERDAAGAGAHVAGSFRYALVVERGPRAGLTYVLGDGATLAGRAEDVAIFLGDVTVSRHHARFTVDDGGLAVEDMGSTNGTYVNMERLDRSQLSPGDEIIIGKFHLVVVRGDG